MVIATGQLDSAIIGRPEEPVIIAVGATSTPSASAFSPGVDYLVNATTSCRIKAAAAPTALATSTIIWKGIPYVMTFDAALKVAAIKLDSSDDDGTIEFSALVRKNPNASS